MKKSTLTDVAKHAEVSIATVSRVFNGHKSISPETRDKVLKVARGLNYRPNMAARELASKSDFAQSGKSGTGIVKVFTRRRNPLSHDLYIDISDGIMSFLRDNSYQMLVAEFPEGNPDDIPDSFWDDNIAPDGAILVGDAPEKILRHYLDKGRPVVVVDTEPCLPEVPWISSDSFSGIIQAMKHFIENGHKRIAYAGSLTGTYSWDERFAAYRLALADNGIEFDKDIVVETDSGLDKVCEDWSAFMQSDSFKDVTAVMCCNDLTALGIIKACRKADIKIPERLNICGYDGSELCNLSDIKLTTVKAPFRQMGELAVKMLLADMENSLKFIGKCLLPVELEINETSSKSNLK